MKNPYYYYVALYTCIYAALGALLPLIGQYLAYIGFSGTQIGTITAAGTAVAIFSSAFWGEIYSNSRNKRGVVIGIYLCLAACAILLSQIKSYVLFLVGFCILYFFYGPVMALMDSMTLEARQPFGAARKWGAVGFAASVFAAGRLAQYFSLRIIFPIYSIGFAIGAILILGIIMKFKSRTCGSGGRGPQTDAPAMVNRLRYGDVFRSRRYLKLVVCAFFINGTTAAHNTYYGFLYKEAGGTIAGLGLAFLLMAGSEAPFMAWSARLADRFTLEKTILAAMCLSVLRFGWYSTGPSPALLTGLFFLQGMVNGILLVELVRYISKLVPERQIGMAMAAYYAVASNCSTILCQLAGGVILDHFNGRGVYFFFAVFNLAGVILYVIFGLYKKNEKK